MNGSSAINYLTNEQLIGKFHVINVDKITGNNQEEIIPQISSITDESGCASRFQMIRVDRNFGRGRWKVNDYEPPENTSITTVPTINTIENESINNSIVPNNVTADSNATPSATLAASVASAAATVFQQQQQRMSLNNTPTVVPTANVPPPMGLLHPYPPAALANQSYLLSNHPHHHQFGYYPFYPPYSPYASPWAAALAASHSFLQPPTLAPQQKPTTNHNDPSRISDTVSDINGENTFSNLTSEQLQHAQLAAAASYLYTTQHLHSSFVPQASSTNSSYATIPSYHPVHHPPTILPPQTLPLSQIIPNNPTDIQQPHQIPSLTSPKNDTTKNLLHQSPFLTTPVTKPLIPTTLNGINHDAMRTANINDLLSSSPAPPSLISPINIPSSNAPTASLSDIWTYTATGSPLNLTQTAAQTAVAAMGLLNNDTSQNTEIANEILKELTTPTKQNNTADIDNKISAAMDLVKMHLLSAVREEVTELRQQIRTLNEKVNNIEHENTFLRQHVPSEIYAQYIPPFVTLSSSNDSTNSTINPIPSIPLSSSSQPVPMTSLSNIPSSLVQSTTNFPLT